VTFAEMAGLTILVVLVAVGASVGVVLYLGRYWTLANTASAALRLDQEPGGSPGPAIHRLVPGDAGMTSQADPQARAELSAARHGLTAAREALGEARTALATAQQELATAREDAAAAREDAAAARAEAVAARAEAGRVLVAARSDAEALAERARLKIDAEAAEALAGARRSGERESARLASAARELKDDVERRELRLAEREERVCAEHQRLEQRDSQLAELEAQLGERSRDIEDREAQLAAAAAAADLERQAHAVDLQAGLERIAGLTAEAAKTELVRAVETQAKREAALLVRELEAEAKRTGEQRARAVVVDAVQRVASEQTAESVVSVLHLPGDEMKGRIIGREGRNIRAYETVTGVNLVIDDTPEAVLLSCFDPVRREIGRLTLEKLVLDGRIHPHRIEEVHERSRLEVEELCVRAGEDALVQVGLTDVHPELVRTLGRLKYRTSYGQNVLKHLVETAHIAGIMAAELGIEPQLVKRGAFLHDIGKALTHEIEGSHALVGADLARRYGESDEVVHAIAAHHNEVQPQTVEAVLTQAADSCSGGRPGARRESLEAYVKRLERIEEIATTKAGVERVFAMQAGREVRVMVKPDAIDDLAAFALAKEVAKQIEDELTYPGQIRVTVVRESRASEIAR
jgi:ribonuclease Y